MGVPFFMVWLLKHYRKDNLILYSLTQQVDSLYLDANCLFHPQCFKILEHNKSKSGISLENLMIKRILEYMDFLISFVNPKNEIFISVDGVAPIAKVNQQRKRRYRSADD